MTDSQAHGSSDRKDSDLLMHWRDGDELAGEELFQRHFRPIHRFFRAKLNRDVDDLVQRTFLGCLEAANRFDPSRPLRPYLFEIARRQLFKYLEGEQRFGRRDPSTFGDLPMASLDPTPSQNASEHESRRLLLWALRRLPLDLQTTVELHYWEGLTMAQIGEVFSIPAGTVKSRLHKARELLRKEMRGLELTENLWRTTLDSFDAWAGDVQDRPTDP